MHSNEKGVTKPNHPKSVSKKLSRRDASYARDLESLAEAKQIYNGWVQELRKVVALSSFAKPASDSIHQ
jgi:hypothetical protein